MTGGRTSTALRVGMALAALGVAASACSSDSSAPESERRCAVVQSKDISELAGTKVELLQAEKGSSTCRYASKDGSVEVRLGVDGPVEKGFPKLLLTQPSKVEGVGDEAWFGTRNTPLGTRLLARRRGALLTLDLSATKLTGKQRRALAEEIAALGVPNLPKMAVKASTGLRGDAACAPFKSKEIAVALGGVVQVTPTAPPGSCHIDVPDQQRSAGVTVLMESGAGQAQLDSIVAGAPKATKTTVGKAPAYWIEASQGPTSGGQLDVLANGKVLQASIFGQGFAPGEAQAIATKLAQAAIGD